MITPGLVHGLKCICDRHRDRVAIFNAQFPETTGENEQRSSLDGSAVLRQTRFLFLGLYF